jgi:DNA-binding transcriptional MerR regulator
MNNNAEMDGLLLQRAEPESNRIISNGPSYPVSGPCTPAAEKTYHSISEVSAILGVRPHVLRYWETQFPVLRPKKGRSGSRMYRSSDVEIASRIKTLLYEKGFTIKGARRRIRLERKKEIEQKQLALGIDNPWADGLSAIREDLVQLLGDLRPEGRGPFRSA